MFDIERIINFIPPDDEFELNRLDMQLKPLISILVDITNKSETREYKVKVKTNFKNRSFANNVCIFIPVPLDIQKSTFKTTSCILKW